MSEDGGGLTPNPQVLTAISAASAPPDASPFLFGREHRRAFDPVGGDEGHRP